MGNKSFVSIQVTVELVIAMIMSGFHYRFFIVNILGSSSNVLTGIGQVAHFHDRVVIQS